MASPQKENQSSIVKIGKRLRPLFNRWIARDSEVGDRPVFDPTDFSFTGDLEARWQTVRDEAVAVMDSHAPIPALETISPDHSRIATDGRWHTFFLWGYGYRIDANCRRCPETTRLVEGIPGLNSALFSILGPGADIPRHIGVTKAILTCHLGLIVPQAREHCTIQVDHEVLQWHEGKTLVFDDTYHHEVHNRTTEQRVVLLIQFRRPTRYPGKLMAYLFLNGVRWSPFVQSARRNIDRFEALHR